VPGRRTTTLVALALTALVLVSCGGRTTAVPRLTVAVDTAATPLGWSPVAYGNAQVSVPSNWVIGLYECDFLSSGGTVWLDTPRPFRPVEGCAPGTNDNAVSIRPETVAPAGARRASVNGITVFWTGDESYAVPSLSVEVSTFGPMAGRILRTLSRSPEAVALAPGPAPVVPSSWHRVSYGGVSLAVPSVWLNTNETEWSAGVCSPVVAPDYADSVLFVSGTSMSPDHLCAAPQEPPVPEVQPVDGVAIDPGPYGPIQGDSDFASCLTIHGLPACPVTYDYYGAIVLSVRVPANPVPAGVETHRVAVEIGLAGNGMVARTILYSMRSA
jgi:hypothetical protein